MNDEIGKGRPAVAFTSLFIKELRTSFNAPIAYIVIVAFLVFSSVWAFSIQQFLVADVASLRRYYGVMPMIFIIIIPALTMRSWAEERRLGTEEILLTLPLGETAAVGAKFAAGVVLLSAMLVLTVPVPLSVSLLGDFDAGQVAGEYAGLILLGMAAVSVGQFVSSLSRNQISAFIGGVGVLMVFTLIGFANVVTTLPGWLASTVRYLSFDEHFQSFIRGVFDTRDAAYFLMITALFLSMTARVLIARKWR